MEKLLNKIGMFFDSIKSLLLVMIAIIVLVLVIGMIVHNVIKINEIPGDYTGEYLNLVQSTDKRMNVYSLGESEQKIVILSDYAIYSPVLEYKKLAEKLSEKYQVIIVEYYGYGFSSDIKTDRTNENYVEEIHSALINAGIEGSYILMPISISNLYAMQYSISYPEEVQAIISYDSIYPEEINNLYVQEYYKNIKINSSISSFIENFGLYRILSYIKPEQFRIDQFEDLGYSDEEINLYRKMIANNYYTTGMVNQIKELSNNMKKLIDFKYNFELPVLSISSSEYRDKYDKEKKNKDRDKNINDLQKSIFTNAEIQKGIVIEGCHELNLDNIEKISESIFEYFE